MTETTGQGLYNGENFMEPLEHGVTEKFDHLFSAREKTLQHWVATKIQDKQEFLTSTYPRLITMGAEHPKLSGGVLYMLGLLSPRISEGSIAINSIPRRFAENLATKKHKDVRELLTKLHKKNETALKMDASEIPGVSKTVKSTVVAAEVFPPEKRRVVNQELERARLTRELYNFERRYVDVRYDKDGKTVDLGKNGGLVSILNKDSKTGKIAVFFSQSGGDPPGLESFVVAYAMKTGDKCVVLGMPDSHSGDITKEFAETVYKDAHPPSIDLAQQFTPPGFEAHTAYFKNMVNSLLPNGERFDLYSHSGGALPAKNLLNDPTFSQRVDNAVFVNPAGVANMYRRFPFMFRVGIELKQLWRSIRDLPHIFRVNYEKDKRQDARTPGYLFRATVSMALQDGSHYRQPGWDTMKVNGGKVVLYVGGKDDLTGGKQFARYMKNRLTDAGHPASPNIHLEYDKLANHGTALAKPEQVLDRIFTKYFPHRSLT